MVDIIARNGTITFDSVSSIQSGLRGKGNKRLAAIIAAGRYPYPEDHEEERQEIINTIFQIGKETQDRDVWGACVTTLWAMNILLMAQLQADPPQARAEAVSLEEHVVRAAVKSYPYSELAP